MTGATGASAADDDRILFKYLPSVRLYSILFEIPMAEKSSKSTCRHRCELISRESEREKVRSSGSLTRVLIVLKLKHRYPIRLARHSSPNSIRSTLSQEFHKQITIDSDFRKY